MKEPKQTKFSDLRVGDMFRFNHMVWIKIEPKWEHVSSSLSNSIKVNAEQPTTNHRAYIGPDRMCTRMGNTKKTHIK